MKTSLITITFIGFSSLGLISPITTNAQDEPEESRHHHEEDDDHEEERRFSVTEIEKFLKKHLPIYSEMLAEAKQESWHEYIEGIEMAAELLEEYHELREDGEKMAAVFLQQHQTESEIEKLAGQWHETKDKAARKQIEIKMRTAIGTSFDLELKMLRTEIKQMKQEVAEMEAELEKEATSKEEIIEESLNNYLHDNDDE